MGDKKNHLSQVQYKARFIAGRKSTGYKDKSDNKILIHNGDTVRTNKYNKGRFAYKSEGVVVERNATGELAPEGQLFIKYPGIDDLATRTVKTLVVKK